MVKSCEMMFRELVHQDAAGLVVGGAGSAISGMWNGKKGASARGLGSQAMGFNIRDLDDLVQYPHFKNMECEWNIMINQMDT